MGDLLDFELEELSAAFAGMDRQYGASKQQRIEIGYQEESNPQLDLLDLDDCLVSIPRRSSFADGTCGDQSPILCSPKRTVRAFPAPGAARMRGNTEGELKRKRTASEAGVGVDEKVSKVSRSQTETGPAKDVADGNPKSLMVEVKERKCVREKQRRAELNEAYESLAQTLSLPPKCKKTALLNKAEETIKALRRHIITLQEAKSRDTGTSAVGKSLSVPAPWVLGTLVEDSGAKEAKASSPASNKATGANDETIERTLVAQMKVCIDRMIKLTEMKQGKKLSTTGVTHSPCA